MPENINKLRKITKITQQLLFADKTQRDSKKNQRKKIKANKTLLSTDKRLE